MESTVKKNVINPLFRILISEKPYLLINQLIENMPKNIIKYIVLNEFTSNYVGEEITLKNVELAFKKLLEESRNDVLRGIGIIMNHNEYYHFTTLLMRDLLKQFYSEKPLEIRSVDIDYGLCCVGNQKENKKENLK